MLFYMFMYANIFQQMSIVLIYDAGSFNNKYFSIFLSSSWISNPKKVREFLYSLAKGCCVFFVCISVLKAKNMEDLYFNHIQNRVYLLYCNVISQKIFSRSWWYFSLWVSSANVECLCAYRLWRLQIYLLIS